MAPEEKTMSENEQTPAPQAQPPAESAPADQPAPAPAQAAPPPEPAAPAPTAPAAANTLPMEQLAAKRMVQLTACTRCGECLNWCPVHDQDPREAVLPRQKAADFLAILKGQHGLLARMAKGGGLGASLASLLGHKAVGEAQVAEFMKNLYECSTCGQCEIVCPAHLDTVNLWEEIRKVMVMAGYGPLEQQKALVKSVKSYDNPWQQPRTSRAMWARRAKKEGLIADTPPEIKKKGGKVLLFFGCTASFDANVRQVAVSTVNLLTALGIDYGILGNDERCCGSVLLRMGDPEFERIATQNLAQFNGLGITTLISACSGCFKTIKEDYPRVGKLSFEVLHTAEFFERLLESGELKFTQPVERVVTYHDPCHLGRAAGVYDAPRQIMAAIPGLQLVEMPRNRQYSRCCGAGGGLKSGYPDIQNKMAQARIREAEATAATELVSCCPFCYQGLQIGIGAVGSPLIARDLTAIMEAALIGKDGKTE